jgi:hypothetical protein
MAVPCPFLGDCIEPDLAPGCCVSFDDLQPMFVCESLL